jgi:hypothetical protein
MSERDATRTTQEIAGPVGATAVEPPAVETPDVEGAPAPDADPGTDDSLSTPAARTSVRARSSGPLTRMGPWAPVAGALVGIVLAVVAVLLLAGRAVGFREGLSLVFLVVGMGLLGASGTLLADEVRMVRWRAREAALRPAAWTDTTASLLNGLTPARLLLLVAGFVLFLAAFVAVG